MLCSKCKIFSIHLPNFDSYICEFGHVFCRTCSPKPYSRCTICTGQIVRRAELLIEGVPKTIFRQTQTEDCNDASDADVDAKVNMDSESEEDWSRLFDFRNVEAYTDNNHNFDSPDHFGREENAARIYNNGTRGSSDIPKRFPSNHDVRKDYGGDTIKTRRSTYQLQTPSSCSIKIEEPSITDPKEFYMKTIYGNRSPDFDSMKSHYDRFNQASSIHEYYKRPEPITGTNSSSKADFRGGDLGVSDSSTVIQHLNEFRRATNYMPPSNVNAYKVKDDEIMSEPAIITTSKTQIDSQKPAGEDHSAQKSHVPSQSRKQVPGLSHTSSSSSKPRKVDVGTMMDICIAPSTNTPEPTRKEPESDSVKLQKKERQSSSTAAEPTISCDTTPKNGSSSLHAVLREKLKHEVYSQFDSKPKKTQNAFMVQGQMNNEISPSRAIQVTAIPKVNRLTDAINTEVEKALKNLAMFPKFNFNGSQKRDEIVKQSKEMIRRRVMEEVYSHFEKSPEKAAEGKENFYNQIQLKGNLQDKNSDAEILVENPASFVKDNGEDNVQDNDTTTIQTLQGSLQERDYRSVGMSTESYPKLNPELSVLIPSKVYTQKSHSNYYSEEHGNEVNKSYLNSQNARTCAYPASVRENDVVNEIFEQFQKNVCLDPNSNGLREENTQPTCTSQFEQLLKVDTLSVNGPYNNTSDRQNLIFVPTIERNLAHLRQGETSDFTAQELSTSGLTPLPQEQMHSNVYYFQQSPHYTFPVGMPAVTTIGDDYTINLKAMAKNLVEDYREEPISGNDGSALDINKFVQYIKEKFPNITLKQLKQIIIHIPVDEPEQEELCELGSRMPMAATFRSGYEKTHQVQVETIDKLADRTTVGYESSDYPTDFSITTSITAWRANFRPPIDLYSEPSPQFKPISPFDTEISIVDHIPREIKAAAELNLPRSPIVCPVTSCSKLVFVSEFSKHIKMDHVKIPVETLNPGRCRNLFIDPRSDDFGVNKCHILYLVTNKIRDLGSKELKDYLPLLVMATKVSLIQLISPKYHSQCKETQTSQQNYLMIWLTGLSPHDLPIYFSLTAWHRYSTIPKCHLVHSGRIYSIRNKHDDRSVYNSGSAMLLSQNQVRLLTNNGQDMIELQVIVH